MSTYLSRYFRKRREALKLRFGEVARGLGGRSLAGVCNKLVRFEERGDIPLGWFREPAAVLEMDEGTIRELIEQDRREYLEQWSNWANQPVKPPIVLRVMPAVNWSHNIPDHLTTVEEIEAFAARLAREKYMNAWLILSRRIAVYFDENGSECLQEAAPNEHSGPSLSVRGSKRKFLFAGPHGIMPITMPEYHGPQTEGPK